jgi:chorismate synthase
VLKAALGETYQIRGGVVQIGPHGIDRDRLDWNETGNNPFFCPDPVAAGEWETYLDGIRKAGSSAGAVLEIVADGVPAGLGQPIYGKLDSDLAAAMMTINAVKGVEIGGGFALSALDGREAGDEMRAGDNGPEFTSNNNGGVLGGISTGQQLVVRVAIKPTSSILTPRRSVDMDGADVEVVTKGRHDPCVGIRGVPVAEAMMAVTVLDALMRHRAQCSLFDG